MEKVLIVIDRPGWAYSTKADQLVKCYRGDRFKFSIVSKKHSPNELKEAFKHNDLYIFIGFQTFRSMEKNYGADPSKTLVSIASHESWDDFQTTPTNVVLPNRKTVNYLRRFRGVSAVSYRLQLLFRFSGLCNVAYTPNGVPLELFSPSYSWANGRHGDLLCAYAGRDKDQKKKNRTIIEPAVGMVPGVQLKTALCDFKLERRSGSRGTSYLKYEKMPAFYRSSDVLICSSREEGSCRSVLEAMASGCVVLSTECGAINELLIHGYNGYLFDMNVRSLVEALEMLKKNRALIPKMKRRSREIVEQYSWQVVAPHWYRWIESVL